MSGSKVPERVSLGISSLIVIALFVAAGWIAFTHDSVPPDVTVTPQLDAVRHVDDRWYVPVTITNRGDKTVANATVLGELDTGGPQPDSGEITINFLAGGETVEGEIVFPADPSSGETKFHVTSFEIP